MSVKKRPCPICQKPVSTNGGAWRSHLAKHTGKHWNSDNHYAIDFREKKP